MRSERPPKHTVSIEDILENVYGAYEGGDLGYYDVVLVDYARNLRGLYHAYRHMVHTTWLCHDACLYYADVLSPRQRRWLLIAAMMHDANHMGRAADGNDDVNIKMAKRFFEEHVAPEDRPYIDTIESYIEPTKFPYDNGGKNLSLEAQILRDADRANGLDPVWFQMVIMELGAEMGLSPREMLVGQEPFLSQLTFYTEWAQEVFPQDVIQARITSVRRRIVIWDRHKKPMKV
ncbi:MAG TPA: HD domain-containing protein [Candidatus Andersenbacteria bacterium]|nr:HD domain-containing protein [Candidatus Andersenbacteria bacterium]